MGGGTLLNGTFLSSNANMSSMKTARIVDWYPFHPSEYLPPFTLSGEPGRLILCLPTAREIRTLLVRDGGKLTEEQTLRNLQWSPAGAEYLADGPGGGWFLSIESTGTIRRLSMRALRNQEDWEIDHDWLAKADVPQAATRSIRMLGIKSFPSARKALAFGAADEPTGGFIQPYGWSNTDWTRERLRSKLYEAPYDIDFWNDTFFVATGRGQTIERLRVDDLTATGESIVSSSPIFKPGRVKVSGPHRLVWVASYNEIFWGGVEDQTLHSHIAVTSEKDFIGDLALGVDGFVFASCTNSNEIRVIEPTACGVSSLPIADYPSGCPTLERPVWLKAFGDLLFVAGYDNGVIWVLSVA